MVNYKEILRLSHEGYSQRQLESSLHCFRHTIREVLTAAKANGITYPLDDSLATNNSKPSSSRTGTRQTTPILPQTSHTYTRS